MDAQGLILYERSQSYNFPPLPHFLAGAGPFRQRFVIHYMTSLRRMRKLVKVGLEAYGGIGIDAE
jgi:hypothetical protein